MAAIVGASHSCNRKLVRLQVMGGEEPTELGPFRANLNDWTIDWN